MDLLSKTRKLNSILQNGTGKPSYFEKISETLSEVLEANTFIVNQQGELLGFSFDQPFENEQMKTYLKDRQFPTEYTNKLFNIQETSPNLDVHNEYTAFPGENKELFQAGLTTIVPIIGGGERLGTLILARIRHLFHAEDLILGEYGSTVVGMEILREKAEKIEEETRNTAIVKMAVSSLSYSELEAVEHVFNELEGSEGILVASKIADRFGITRSVIVNALRKLESAGIIETRSLGMKGTHIKVLNEYLFTVLKN